MNWNNLSTKIRSIIDGLSSTDDKAMKEIAKALKWILVEKLDEGVFNSLQAKKKKVSQDVQKLFEMLLENFDRRARNENVSDEPVVQWLLSKSLQLDKKYSKEVFGALPDFGMFLRAGDELVVDSPGRVLDAMALLCSISDEKQREDFFDYLKIPHDPGSIIQRFAQFFQNKSFLEMANLAAWVERLHGFYLVPLYS